MSTLLSSTVLIPHPYSNNLVHRQERRFARQRYLIFDTLRTRTTTLDELNEDEPGNADAPPHHHGKLTTRTTTSRRCSEAQDNRRAWRRRGRARLHRPAAADCRISDSGWRTQVATAARLMVADGCGLRQRTKHVEDDQGEL